MSDSSDGLTSNHLNGLIQASDLQQSCPSGLRLGYGYASVSIISPLITDINGLIAIG